ncbi:Clp protease N-terminal domain-containing protein [Micromonospora sp. CA-111912]|uniref:Clp protease N-terminal domain-containing protein n=1 Tax=Micromonospora sp. CA-111912 TaxID=3239955 RepID=UPI003D8E336E
MPKINVYLPDDLAGAVRDSGVPVSAICQRALEQAVRQVTAIRQVALAGLEADDLAERLPRFTARARTVVKLAIARARVADAASVGTGDLLAGMLAEGENLALHVLQAMEIDPALVQRDLDRRPANAAEATDAPSSIHFSRTAASALEITATEAIAMGHNYVGCEHLLVGLAAEPDGTAGQVLRTLGAEPRLVRRAVTAALAGYMYLRAQAPAGGGGTDPTQALVAAVHQQLQPLVARVETLERRLDAPR